MAQFQIVTALMAGYWAPTIHLAVSAALSPQAPEVASAPHERAAPDDASGDAGLPGDEVSGGGGARMPAPHGGAGGRMEMLEWALANAEALQVCTLTPNP